jgi:hypothetical protein
MTTDKPPANGLDDGFARHSRRALAAGAVLVLAAVGAIWALTTSGSDNPTATAAAYDSACGLTGGSTATPTTGPEVQWQNVDGNWLPVSTTQGPGKRSATGPWSCYAHTPTGAVLAAWGIPARMGVATDFAGVVKQQTLPGPAQAALIRTGPGKTPVADRPVPVGYRINSYDATAATITMYARQRGATISCAAGVQWVGAEKGDWILRLGSDGSVWLGCQQVSDDLTSLGLVPWGPQS